MFPTIEESRQLGEPIHLYLFKYGDDSSAFYAYTDAEQDFTFGGVTYKAVPIDRDNIKAAGTLDNSDFQMRSPADAPLADLFRVYPPDREVSVIIRQGHLDDPDSQFLVCWTGRILSAAFNGNEVTYNCQPVSTAMRRAGLRKSWQYGCPHALYGPQCQADQAAATSAAIVASVTGNSVTLPSTWAAPALKPKYLGGMVTWTGSANQTERRMIVKVTGDTLLLAGLVRNLVPGQTINVVLGCNHKAGMGDDCVVLHNNIVNFGGAPWIPSQNPIGQRINFY